MHKKINGNLSVGTSTILVIFILLCLVTFATLSLVTARADFAFTQKNADTVTQYYAACNIAENKLAEIDNTLLNSYKSADSSAAYFTLAYNSFENNKDVECYVKDNTTFVTYTTKINERQILNVCLKLTYPKNEGETFYTITAWQVVDIGTWQPDEGLPVYTDNSDSGTSLGALPTK